MADKLGFRDPATLEALLQVPTLISPIIRPSYHVNEPQPSQSCDPHVISPEFLADERHWDI